MKRLREHGQTYPRMEQVRQGVNNFSKQFFCIYVNIRTYFDLYLNTFVNIILGYYKIPFSAPVEMFSIAGKIFCLERCRLTKMNEIMSNVIGFIIKPV